MGKTYSVPRSAKGESRILNIFTVKSLLSTIGFAAIGLIPFLILKAIGLTTIGVIVLIAFAALGYGMVMLTIPDAPMMGKLRKAGGEKLGDIVWRTLTFRKRKAIYLYREGGKKLWDKVWHSL